MIFYPNIMRLYLIIKMILENTAIKSIAGYLLFQQFTGKVNAAFNGP